MQHLIPFRHRQNWYAVDASHVEQILGAQPWMRVPGAPPLFPGVMAWRGRAMAVLDLAQLPIEPAGDESAAVNERPPRTLVLTLQGCALGIPTDEVREALPLETLQLLPLRLNRVRFARNEFELQGHIAVVLDMPALIESVIGQGKAEGSQ